MARFRQDRWSIRILVACVALVSVPVARADGPAVINCPWNPPNVGDDFASHGFYTLGFAATSLKQVVLPLSFPSAGTYQLSLTASKGSYDGTLLGTAMVTFTAPGTDFQSVTFNFGTIPVTEGATLAFSGAVVTRPSGVTGSVLMQTATDPLCRLTETTGTDAPLSSFRRGGIAALIYGDVATTFNHTVTIAAAASIHGANRTFFHTDVWINNPLAVSLSVTATYHCYAGQNCGAGTATFTIGASSAMTFTDVVSSLFGAPETAGAISFTYPSSAYDSTLRVVSRTYTPSLPSPTVGAALEGLAGVNAVGNVTFVGLGNNGGNRSAGFRTNAGLYNPAAYPTTVTFTLTTTGGTPIGQPVTQTWASKEARQVNDIFSTAGAGATVITDAVLHVTSTLPVFPYVTVIDNQTGDSVIEQ